MTLEQKVAAALTDTKKTVSLAESCTGGLLGDRLTNIPGSSDFFKGGLIVYSNEAKTKLLKITPSLLKKHGAVSQPVVSKMAHSVRKLYESDFGIAISGIAGPSGGSKTKPVGLVHIAVATNKEALSVECFFKGNRKSIKRQASSEALRLLLEFLP